MKLLNITVRNILVWFITIALVIAVLWLVRGQTQAPLTAQAITTTNTPLPANTPTPTETNTPLPANTPAPTETNTPSIPSPTPFSPPLTPIRTTPYLSFAATPEPGLTYTPTPIKVEIAAVEPPAVIVAETQMLPLNQLRPFSSMADEDVSTYALFEAVGWTERGEVILQERNSIKLGDSYYPGILYEVTGTWAVSPKSGAVRPLFNWTPSKLPVVMGSILGPTTDVTWIIHSYDNRGKTSIDWSAIPGWTSAQQQLAREWSAKKQIEFGHPQNWLAASDGETVVLNIVRDKTYILKPGQPEPVTLPKDKGHIKSYISEMPQLSPDGQRVAYGVRFDNPDINNSYDRETDTYEIQISNLDGTDTVVIQLPYEYNFPALINWSPDNKFIAFAAQPEDRAPSHLYIAAADGLAITDITPNDFNIRGFFHWLKDGPKLLYSGGNPDDSASVGYWIASFTK